MGATQATDNDQFLEPVEPEPVTDEGYEIVGDDDEFDDLDPDGDGVEDEIESDDEYDSDYDDDEDDDDE